MTRSGLDVLVICTGNVCRSPYLALRLAAGLPSLRVGSAGTAARSGAEPTAEIAAALARHGVCVDGQRARRLTTSLIRRSRLVLTATDDHRREVLLRAPDAAHRTFTVREFARLVDGLGAGLGMPGAVAAADAAGDPDRAADPADDLVDPYLRGPDAYDRMVAQADEALAAILRALHA